MTMKTVCKVCGRRARRRCPALGAYICTRCCGSRRGPDFGCSGDCEFYPFGIAGYDFWLRLYDALIPKIVKRVAAETDEIHMESLVRSFGAVTEMYGENPDAPAFLDEEIPALGGMTPREASARPEARPMLIELMKEHIHGIDRMNRDEGTDISLSCLLKELGLDELIV